MFSGCFFLADLRFAIQTGWLVGVCNETDGEITMREAEAGGRRGEVCRPSVLVGCMLQPSVQPAPSAPLRLLPW